jgi:thiol-disulfide isomerase/thioredoxin
MAANDTPGAPWWRRWLFRSVAAAVILAAVAAGLLTGRGSLLFGGGNDLVTSAYPLLTGEVQNFLLFRGTNPAPEMSFIDGRRDERTLAEFRGRYVLLNFWANWCVPCREEMPSLDRLQQRLGSERFHVLALSQDLGGLSTVSHFFVEIEIEHLIQYSDATARTQYAFDVPGLPATFLIDPEGSIIGRMVGPAEWDSPAAMALIRHFVDGDAIYRDGVGGSVE